MKNIREYTGKIVSTERMKNSVNGNPRYGVTFQCENGSIVNFVTAVDSSLGYTITNYANSDQNLIRVAVGIHYNRYTLDSIVAVVYPNIA